MDRLRLTGPGCTVVDMQIRKVNVELLRAGPRHNQLLSPLTQYLGICGDNPAGVVTLPFEQARFERMREEFRYEVSAADNPGRLAGVIDEAGTEMAQILAKIPGIAGLFTNSRGGEDELLHLRLTLSASELALLPFELSRIPAGGTATPDSRLALHTRSPTCLTRHIRSVRSDQVRWYTRPRILFISSDGHDVPTDEHERTLLRALSPWIRRPAHLAADPTSPREEDEWLTTMRNPSLGDIRAECSRVRYTHVHILAHGAEDPNSAYTRYGIHLGQDVVSGVELASAITTLHDNLLHLPTVVTMATCDSGAGGDVVMPDSSVAYELHRKGIPFVVASQFPLSVPGSVPFVDSFYSDQLRGVHPLKTMYEIRLRLHSEMGRDFHDWASLVVYEALPDNFEVQCSELRYWQAKRALDVALNRLRLDIEPETVAAALPEGPNGKFTGEKPSWFTDLAAASKALPTSGPYSVECLGLRAAGNKRLAYIAFRVAEVVDPDSTTRHIYLGESHRRLEDALVLYWDGVRRYMSSPTEDVHRKATLHWLLSQAVSVELILGRPFHEKGWMTAMLSAEYELERAETKARAWGHSTLAELWLLRLADATAKPAERAEYSRRVLNHVQKLVSLCPRNSEQALTTVRQYRRYIDWWGCPLFSEYLDSIGLPKRKHWHDSDGLIATAREAVARLSAPGATPKKQRPAKKKAAAVAATPSTRRKRSTKKKRATRARSLRRSSSATRFDIDMLPAENGDCLWIEYGDPDAPRRILIDCGAPSAARVLSDRIAREANGGSLAFELFVMTHIDADHISGAIPLFADKALPATFEDIWFNGWKQLKLFLSVKQGEEFSRMLADPERGLPWNRAMSKPGDEHPRPVAIGNDGLPSFELADGMVITLLSPGQDELTRLARRWGQALAEMKKKRLLAGRAPPPPVTDFEGFPLEELANTKPKRDTSVANGSSIAFLAEFDGRSALFTGDAHAGVLRDSIATLQEARGKAGERLALDAFKLSHHGSGNAMTRELLDVVDCRRFLVPTDGSRFFHPHREAIARVVTWGGDKPELCFNYTSELNGLWASELLQEKFGYTTRYPEEGDPGLRVAL